jgi:hypothetical protein
MTVRAKKRSTRAGRSAEAWLAEEGTLEQSEAVAIKRVLAWQLAQSMKDKGMSKQALADIPVVPNLVACSTPRILPCN